MADPRTINYGRYQLRHPWPADCMVQGSGQGLVLRRDGEPYRTAFVEAFPRDPDTFLRGEGEDLAAAEDAVWAQFERVTGCQHGNGYDRRGYRNGSGFCKDCGMFASDVFTLAEIGSICVVCGIPNYWRIVDGKLYCQDHAPEKRYSDSPISALFEKLAADAKEEGKQS